MSYMKSIYEGALDYAQDNPAQWLADMAQAVLTPPARHRHLPDRLALPLTTQPDLKETTNEIYS